MHGAAESVVYCASLPIPVKAEPLRAAALWWAPAAVHWAVVVLPVAFIAAALAAAPEGWACAVLLLAAAAAAAYIARGVAAPAPPAPASAAGGAEAPPRRRRVAVLGAGPCGLAALKELRDEGHDAVCYEAGPIVGGVYARTYDSARLTSSPYVTAFSDYPPPPGTPLDRHMHWTAKQYVEYLQSYAEHFGLLPHIRFGCWVESVRSAGGGQWRVRVGGAEGGEVFDAVAVCTGPNGTPNRPAFPGVETFPGPIVHSNEYRNAEPYRGQRVVVVGLGETSADLAAEIGAAASGAILSVRQGGAFVIPRQNPLTGDNNDYDSNRLRYSVPKWMHNLTAAVCAGMRYACGMLDENSAERYRLLRASGKPAFSQFATKSDNFVPALLSGQLALRPGVERIDGRRVHFADGSSFDADAIVLCTGYGAPPKRMFPFLAEEDLGCGCVSKMYKYCMPVPHRGTLAFFGLARPHIGTIPMMGEIQSRYFARVLSGAAAFPSGEEAAADVAAQIESALADFADPRLKTMVNWIAYVDQLAGMIGCRPSMSLWWRDPSLAWKLVVGPYTAAHLRISGPGSREQEARKVVMSLPNGMRMRDQLWFLSLHCVAAAASLIVPRRDRRTSCQLF